MHDRGHQAHVDDLRELVARFKALVKDRTGHELSRDPWDQLQGADRRRLRLLDERPGHRLPPQVQHSPGMGHRGQRAGDGLRQHRRESGSGVAFTRDPATGEKVFYGEFLMNAQGEDVVAGVRTPEPVLPPTSMPGPTRSSSGSADPRVAFQGHAGLRVHDPGRRVYMLQTRNGKRTGVAAVRIAAEMVKEKLIDWQTAILRVPADQLDQVLAPIFDRAGAQGARRRSPPACPPAPAPPPAGSTSTPTAPSRPPPGREGPPRAHGDLARGPARHDRGRGHPHRPRRRLLPRGPRGPPDGQGLRLRREPPSRSTTTPAL
jgi:hypothetical protein